VFYWQDGTSGFEAAAYTNGNEIVVSFAGTDFDSEKYIDNFKTNLPLGQGNMTNQLKQAAEFVQRIRDNPASQGKRITFTGHSLGGGLAAPSGEVKVFRMPDSASEENP
jgi:hypothetical protein